jgi:3'-5' exoribonuclease
MRRMEDHEVEFADFYPCSVRDPEEMFSELLGIIAGIGNPHLRSLLEAVFGDKEIAGPFKLAPAAKSIHHAWRGGLLEHVLSLCTLAKATGPHYPGIDLDLLLTGAILHDVGKIEELTFARSFGYSADGQMLGHIVLGLRLLGRKFDALPDFPAKLRSMVEHIVVSHHGELAYGSPKVPVFAEALLFHHLDNLDSKMNALECALKRDHQVEGEFTSWISSLERVLMKKERYLQGPVVKAPAQPFVAVIEDFPAPAAPEPVPVSPLPVKRAETQQPVNSLFAEKLQAVLGPQK